MTGESWMNVASGFALGVAFYHCLVYYTAMVRPCCRAHYATHPDYDLELRGECAVGGSPGVLRRIR